MNLFDDERFSKFSFSALFIIVILVSFKIVAPFLIAIIAGALLAQTLRPIQNMLMAKKINPKLSAYLVLIFFVVVMVVPLFFFIQTLITEIGKFTKIITSSDISFASITDQIKNWPIVHYFIADPSSLNDQLKSLTKSLAETVSKIILYLVGQIPMLIVDTIFILLSFIVFLINGEKIKDFVSNLIPLDQYIKDGLMTSSNEITKMASVASIMAAMGQTITTLTGFLILNIPNVFFASVATFILSFIPFIGSVPVWIAGVIYLIFKGSAIKIVFMIIIGIMASIIDNLIRAFFLNGSKNKLHPLIGFISVIGGIKVFGLLGMLIGPIVATLLLSMCKIWPGVLARRKSIIR